MKYDAGNVMRCLHLFLVGSFLAAATLGTAQMGEFQPKEALVRFRHQFGREDSSSRAHLAIGATVRVRIPELATDRVQLPSGMPVVDAVAYYQSRPEVIAAEPNYQRQLCYSPNDTQFALQDSVRQTDCDDAWTVTKGKSSIVVAVIDIGIDKNHPDLKAKVVPGWDFVQNDSDPDASGNHGVHTAGIVAADTDNGVGIAGTGFNTRVMALKLTANLTSAQSAQAIIYAANHGAKVISMSYGGSQFSSTENSAANYAWSKGCVLVAAAGNTGTNTPLYPSGYDAVIGVGSVDSDDSRSGFSNGGAQFVDVAAPGEGILSTIIGGGYGNMSGTSMSCPHVAGIVALLWSLAGPATTNTQIRAAHETNCDSIGDWVKYGRVNARRAVQAMTGGQTSVFPPDSIQMIEGSGFSGSLLDVLTIDANTFRTTSSATAAGQVASVDVLFPIQGPVANLRRSRLSVVGNGAANASLLVLLYDPQTNRLNQIRAVPLRAAGSQVSQVDLPKNLSPFLSGGRIKVRLRAIVPHRPGNRPPSSFDFKLNFAIIQADQAN
ncbi:MAG: S8 family serine peptidase [Chlorobia bacterium]|nr:S8 family serine peptidase [Fimbriimonadaceae bacterium]